MRPVTAEKAELRCAGLLRRYPELNALRWRVRTLQDAPLDAISRVIQSAWERAYGKRVRIAFSPGFFRYVSAAARSHGIVTFALDEDGVCGVLAGVPMDWADAAGKGLGATLSTGLSTTARWESAGLVEMLMAKHALNLIDAGHALSFQWRATKSQHEEQLPARTIQRAGQVVLFAKPLRCGEAIRRGGLSWWEGLGVRGLALRHPVRRRLPAPLSMTHFDVRRALEYAAFVNDFQPENGLRRRFFPETLQGQCTFAEEPLRGAGLAFHDGQNLAGMVWGYVNPVDVDAAYFAVDGAVFHPSLPAARRLGCLEAAEAHARDGLGCFAVLIPGSVCRLPLARRGYLPVRRYALGAVPYLACPQVKPESVGGAFIELR